MWLAGALLLGLVEVRAQKMAVSQSQVSFYSHAPIEDISASNTKAAGLFNPATGELVFSIPIREFQFEKSLMQEHFNEKYMESEKYPKATFQGKVIGFDASATAQQAVRAQGKLSIHGVAREVEIAGTIEGGKDQLKMKSVFNVKLEDHQITRPQLLWQNIAEVVEVTVDFTFRKQ
jgi:polyisoprenoid-binding protein YceI